MQKREPEIVVLSDIHLGTFGCHATELLEYLVGIQPKLLILNGDIIDIWQFSKRYFPASHMQVIKEWMSMMSRGTEIIYITGNHDESLRRYSGLKLGNFSLDDKLVVDINGYKTWIFHGDVFDATTKGTAKLIAKLGGHGYDILIIMNRIINWLLELMGRGRMSFSKKVKESVKKAVSWIGNFEDTAAELAISRGYSHVICGHIHQPQIRTVKSKNGEVIYMNSGDWIENLTSLEFNDGNWRIYVHETNGTKRKRHSKSLDFQQLSSEDVFTDDVSFFLNSVGLLKML